MEAFDVLWKAQAELEPIIEVESPRKVTERPKQIAVRQSLYNPIKDELELSEDVKEESIQHVKYDLIQKYLVDEAAGKTGLKEIEELEQKAPLYHKIDSSQLFETETEVKVEDEEVKEEFGELLTEEETLFEQQRELENKRKLRSTEFGIGNNEEIDKRLAVLNLSERIEDVINRYEEIYETLEEEKDRLFDEYFEWSAEVQTEELAELVDDEEALDEVFAVRNRYKKQELELMERMNEKRDEENMADYALSGVDPFKGADIARNYDRNDIANALNKHGIEDEQVIERVYELLDEGDEREERVERKTEELRERQNGLYDQLMREIDKEAERLSQEVDLYLEPIKQRKWKLKTQPAKGLAKSMGILYKAFEEGTLKEDKEVYKQKLHTTANNMSTASDQVNEYLDELIELYENQDGDIQERLSKTFDKAPEYVQNT